MEPFLGNANEREGKKDDGKNASIKQAKKCLFYKLRFPTLHNFEIGEKGRKQLTLNLFCMFFVCERRMKRLRKSHGREIIAFLLGGSVVK